MTNDQLTNRQRSLKRMAINDFGCLSAAEQELIYGVTGPHFAHRGSSNRELPGNDEPVKATHCNHERGVRAALIRWLCVEARVRDQIDPSGIQVHGARIEGELNLSYVVIPFPLVFWKCALTHNAEFLSLEVGLLNFGGSYVRMLNAQGIRVKGDVSLNNGFHADGEVRLTGAQIGGSLDCSSGKFINPIQKENIGKAGGKALNAFNIAVKGSVSLNHGFRSEGEVALLDAQVGGSLYCDGGEFINREVKDLDGKALDGSGKALTISGNIGGNVFLTKNFCAEGKIRLTGAHIVGALELGGGIFKKASLLLDEASAASIHDQGSTWPEAGCLSLNGFVYGFMEPRDVESRLKWLSLQDGKSFYPQPYLQLAKVLGAAGDDEGRRRVLITMRDKEPKVGKIDTLLRWSSKATIGYGYRPLWAFWEVLGLSMLGWIVYRRSYLAGTIVPTDKEAYKTFKTNQKSPSHHRAFFPSIYSVENTLPLIKLGQSEKWQPDSRQASDEYDVRVPANLGNPTRWPSLVRGVRRLLVYVGLLAPEKANARRSGLSRVGTSPKFIRWFQSAQILLGWLLATLFLAGISGIIRKE